MSMMKKLPKHLKNLAEMKSMLLSQKIIVLLFLKVVIGMMFVRNLKM